MVVGVGDHGVAGAVGGHALRKVELGARGGSAVAAVVLGPGAGHRVDVVGGHGDPVGGAGALGHHPDAIVVGVGDHQVAGAVDGHAVGIGEPGRGGGPA